MRVYLLKNENQPNDYYKEVLSQKYEPIFVPLLNHRLFIDETSAFLALQMLNFDIIIVTSQRAVECLQTCIDIIPENIRASILNIPVYTIGPSTYSYLERIGFKTIYGKDSGNGHKLSELILNKVTNERIVYLTGKIRKDIIPNNMTNNGKNFTEFVVYATEEIGSNLQFLNECQSDDWIIFFSPQGTKDIVEQVKNRSKVGVIGPTTNDYLQENGVTVDLICEKPTADSLFSQIVHHELQHS